MIPSASLHHSINSSRINEHTHTEISNSCEFHIISELEGNKMADEAADQAN